MQIKKVLFYVLILATLSMFVFSCIKGAGDPLINLNSDKNREFLLGTKELIKTLWYGRNETYKDLVKPYRDQYKYEEKKEFYSQAEQEEYQEKLDNFKVFGVFVSNGKLMELVNKEKSKISKSSTIPTVQQPPKTWLHWKIFSLMLISCIIYFPFIYPNRAKKIIIYLLAAFISIKILNKYFK